MYKIRLRVRYRHGAIPRGVLALSVLAAGLLVTLSLSRAFATVPSSPASPSAAAAMRQFYLSRTLATGMEAGTICAEGYHFASLWEIVDPSNLRYNPSLGMTSSDSGAGPPSVIVVRPLPIPIPARGWVRTGYTSSTSTTPGRGNCDVWSSEDGAHSGTVVHLVSEWDIGGQDIGVWNVDVAACDNDVRVWCMQDRAPVRLFLPVVIRS
jgi:hypothetical protein